LSRIFAARRGTNVAVRHAMDRKDVSSLDLPRTLIVGAIAGLAASVVMDLFSRTVRSATNGREAPGAAPGEDRAARGAQPPQAERHTEDDATVRAGTAVYRAVSGREPSRAGKIWLGRAAHYAFGVGTGVGYALMSARAPSLRRGFGTMYGTLVWALADEGAVPALGLSKGPREMPLGVHAYALSVHLIYGAALEGTRRLISTDRRLAA